MAWRQFTMKLDTLDPEVVEEILLKYGACSVTLTDAADDPVLEPGPGETPLWSETEITGLFSDNVEFETLGLKIRTELGVSQLPEHRFEVLQDREWEREWAKDFGPMKFGKRLWICPSDSTVLEAGAVIVDLDPGLAFGTGTHATTALCLDWLDELDLSGKTLLDYGCGSGVLAIAGLKLGCRSATAMDIDPQAVLATRQNAANNKIGENLEILGTADRIRGTYDIIVANILAGPLVQFAESITLTLGDEGMLALSGVLCEQVPVVLEAYEPWIEFDEPALREQDGQVWSRLTGIRRTVSH